MGRISDKRELPWSRNGSLVLSLFLVVGTLCAFRWILHLPYVGDDWAIFHKMAFRTPREILALTVDPSLLQIRPLQYLYTWAILAVFGTYSSGFHVPALIAHVCTALLLVHLMRLLLKSTVIAWLVGFLYAIAANIHLAPQMWMVGSSDVLGPLLFFSSFVLLIKGRYGWSAVAFLASLLFKEFALAMLAVMVFYSVQESWRQSSVSTTIGQMTRRFWAHVLVAVPFLVYKMMFLPSPLAFPADHPYKMSFIGPHLIRNGFIYALWFLQTTVPFLISRPRRMLRSLASGNVLEIALLVAFAVLVVTALALVVVRRRMRKPAVQPRERSMYSLLVVWAIMGIAPVYFLPNHVFAYYMAYSLPALLAIVLLLARDLARWAGMRRQEMIGLAAAAIVLQFVWSSNYVNVSLREGDHMLRGAMRVAAVHQYLIQHHRDVPHGTAFVLDGDRMLWALRDDKAVQLWYRDRSLQVFDKRFVVIDDGRVYAVHPPEGTEFPGSHIGRDRVMLAPASVICLRVRGASGVAEQSLMHRQ